MAAMRLERLLRAGTAPFTLHPTRYTLHNTHMCRTFSTAARNLLVSSAATRGPGGGACWPPWRQPRGKWMVSLVNSHTNATSKRGHLWEIHWRFALNSTPGWRGRRSAFGRAVLRREHQEEAHVHRRRRGGRILVAASNQGPIYLSFLK